MHVAHIVLVNVPAQQHGVARAVALNGLQQAFARRRVAIPSVGGHLAAGVAAGREQGLLGQHAPAGVVVLRVCGQAGVQPLLLGRAQQAAGGVCQFGAVGRAHAPRVGGAGFAACLQGAVLAVIQQVQLGQPAPGQAAVHLQPVELRARQGRGTQGHVFVERLPGCSALGQEGRGIGLCIRAPCIVVLHFVVVPGHGPGAGGVGGLQCRVALVQGVAVAVVGQRGRITQCVGAGQALGVFGRGVFVDVVAQKQHQVGLVVADMAPGGVVAMLPPLARRKRHAQAPRQCMQGGGGAGAAGGAGGLPQHEAVVVPAARLQPTHFHMHAVAALWCCGGLALLHDARKSFIVCQLPVHGLGRQGLTG